MKQIECPKCKSQQVAKSGVVKGRQRFRCKECNYFFHCKEKKSVPGFICVFSDYSRLFTSCIGFYSVWIPKIFDCCRSLHVSVIYRCCVVNTRTAGAYSKKFILKDLWSSSCCNNDNSDNQANSNLERWIYIMEPHLAIRW